MGVPPRQMGEYYNTSAGSAEFNALGNPLGFSTAPACVTGDHSTFVAVVDAGVTAARADQLARLLIEGGFLHRQVGVGWRGSFGLVVWGACVDGFRVQALYSAAMPVERGCLALAHRQKPLCDADLNRLE